MSCRPGIHVLAYIMAFCYFESLPCVAIFKPVLKMGYPAVEYINNLFDHRHVEGIIEQDISNYYSTWCVVTCVFISIKSMIDISHIIINTIKVLCWFSTKYPSLFHMDFTPRPSQPLQFVLEF